MSVMVDHEVLPAEQLGLRTVGQVLTHLQRDNRLVVNVLIDGAEPDLGRMAAVRQAKLVDHTIFIETADPRRMALEVLEAVDAELSQAEQLKGEAADLLQRNQANHALQKLGGCLRAWAHAQESVMKTAKLLRIDLDLVRVGERALREVLVEFAEQLRAIKEALQNRDYVTLCDTLVYETTDTSRQWAAATLALRQTIQSL